MVASRSLALAFAAMSIVNASPCPFGQMAERGELSAADSAKFYAARSDGETVVRTMIDETAAKQEKRDFESQEKFYNAQKSKRQLNLGGGLLNGALLPFTGILAGLDVPVPQKFSLAKIPDDNHPYAVPADDAVRGMCPTLNTMANHGYISRDGITTFAEAANACQITLGFGYDTCVFLSALGLLSGGDLVTGKYSIGGADSRVPNTLGPALGISSHGPFEIDQSMSRIDLYHGNSAAFNLARWNGMVADSKKHNSLFGLDTWNTERQRTYQESKDTNPQFDAGAKQLAVSLAERVFIPRAMPNGTAQDVADFKNVAPFYMNETFPKDWFRRSTAYSLANVGTDIVALYAMGPTEPGHNEGFDNFVPLGADLSDLTDGTGLCFLYQSFLSFAPGQIAPAFVQSYDVVVQFLNGAVKPFFQNAACNLNVGAASASEGYAAAGPSAPNTQLINGVYQ